MTLQIVLLLIFVHVFKKCLQGNFVDKSHNYIDMLACFFSTNPLQLTEITSYFISFYLFFLFKILQIVLQIRNQ